MLKKHQPDGSKVNFFNGIPDLYLPDGNALTEKQSDFYQDVKFPNYDDYDDFGTLIDKAERYICSQARSMHSLGLLNFRGWLRDRAVAIVFKPC